MPASVAQVAKRAFVKILLELAALYGLAPNVNRESSAKELEAAFKRVCLKTHPDKGGKRAHFQKLQAARETWQKAQPKGEDHEEWVESIEDGHLADVIKCLKPKRRTGPWHVITDNESFLLTDEAKAEYRKQRVKLWPIPARSPDLNPIELFWGWLSALA